MQIKCEEEDATAGSLASQQKFAEFLNSNDIPNLWNVD